MHPGHVTSRSSAPLSEVRQMGLLVAAYCGILATVWNIPDFLRRAMGRDATGTLIRAFCQRLAFLPPFSLTSVPHVHTGRKGI